MKGLKRISLLVVLFIVFLIGSVYAAEGKMELVKNVEKLKPGQTGTVELKLTSTDKPIVAIQMKIKGSENVEITGITSASEKWSLTAYNSKNGAANLTNTNGSESGSIAKISFKVKEDTKTEEASISVEDFEVSSIEYDYVTISNVSTKIAIEQPKTPEEPNEPEQPEQPNEPEQPEQPKQEEQKEPTKPTDSKNKVDNTIIGGKIPHTGSSSAIILIMAIVAIIGLVSYAKYKKID